MLKSDTKKKWFHFWLYSNDFISIRLLFRRRNDEFGIAFQTVFDTISIQMKPSQIKLYFQFMTERWEHLNGSIFSTKINSVLGKMFEVDQIFRNWPKMKWFFCCIPIRFLLNWNEVWLSQNHTYMKYNTLSKRSESINSTANAYVIAQLPSYLSI